MTHHWRCPEQADRHGTICLAPGLFDHAGLFAPLIKFCLAEGYDLVCIEMPGHGLSDGQYCAIDSFYLRRYLGSLYFAARTVVIGTLVGLGQSTGCTGLTALGSTLLAP